MAAQTAVSSGVLLEANNDACHLLELLSGEAKVGRKVNQYFVNNSQALIFMWTMKAGLGIGLSTGGGFMVSRLSGKKWSAPLFLKATAGQAGFIIGVEKVQIVHSIAFIGFARVSVPQRVSLYSLCVFMRYDRLNLRLAF